MRFTNKGHELYIHWMPNTRNFIDTFMPLKRQPVYWLTIICYRAIQAAGRVILLRRYMGTYLTH